METQRQQATTFEKGHGRLERRELTSTTALEEHLDWPGVRQVCRIVRTTVRKGETSTEVQYAITSVDRDRADAMMLMKWWRGHWGIENRLHWIRDESFGEDRCRVRTGSAPQVLAGVRNLVINWLRSCGIGNIAEALRENAWNPGRLFAKLGKGNN
ncbi:MAG: ISAs1 family transposase [Rubripirellula sp.]